MGSAALAEPFFSFLGDAPNTIANESTIPMSRLGRFGRQSVGLPTKILLQEDKVNNESIHSSLLSAALAIGSRVARWGHRLTRRMGVSVVIGLLLPFARCVGGPTIKTLLEVWSAANDLLNYPRPQGWF
jgi:hypothetical protein